jgi:hypothetical protein
VVKGLVWTWVHVKCWLTRWQSLLGIKTPATFDIKIPALFSIKTLALFDIKTPTLFDIKMLASFGFKTLTLFGFKTLALFSIKTLTSFSIRMLALFCIKTHTLLIPSFSGNCDHCKANSCDDNGHQFFTLTQHKEVILNLWNGTFNGYKYTTHLEGNSYNYERESK